MIWTELLKDAGVEIGVLDPVEEVTSEFQDLARRRLNNILDIWNATQEALYTVTFPTFTTTAGLNPHTIGPSGATWTVSTNRPMAIVGANRQSGSGTSLIRYPINIRDRAWWFNVAVPNLRTSIPTDLYYAPSVGNGSIYFWPVPDSAFTIELTVSTLLAQVAEADLPNTITLPPGYQLALTRTLAEDLVTPMGVLMPDELPDKAHEARAVIFANNLETLRLVTRDSGMMPVATGSGAYNYRTNRGGGRSW